MTMIVPACLSEERAPELNVIESVALFGHRSLTRRLEGGEDSFLTFIEAFIGAYNVI